MPENDGNCPGGSGAGLTTPGQTGVAPTIVYCWMPFAVTLPTWLSMFCRAKYTPKLDRSTDRPSPPTSHVTPTRGWNIAHWLGIVPSDGNRGSFKNGAKTVV